MACRSVCLCDVQRYLFWSLLPEPNGICIQYLPNPSTAWLSLGAQPAWPPPQRTNTRMLPPNSYFFPDMAPASRETRSPQSFRATYDIEGLDDRKHVWPQCILQIPAAHGLACHGLLMCCV